MPLSRERLTWYERQSGECVPAHLWAQLVGEHPLTRRLKAGRHFAPYLSLLGRAVQLQVGRGGALVDAAEVGAASDVSSNAAGLLPRGVHLAPWREAHDPVYLAIDAAHRCVAWIAPTKLAFGLVDIVRDLLLILESHEARDATTQVADAPVSDASWVDEVDDDSDDTTGEEWKRAS